MLECHTTDIKGEVPALAVMRMTTGILFSLSRRLAASSEAAFHGSLGRSQAQPSEREQKSRLALKARDAKRLVVVVKYKGPQEIESVQQNLANLVFGKTEASRQLS